jgi:hypothetical protein
MVTDKRAETATLVAKSPVTEGELRTSFRSLADSLQASHFTSWAWVRRGSWACGARDLGRRRQAGRTIDDDWREVGDITPAFVKRFA